MIGFIKERRGKSNAVLSFHVVRLVQYGFGLSVDVTESRGVSCELVSYRDKDAFQQGLWAVESIVLDVPADVFFSEDVSAEDGLISWFLDKDVQGLSGADVWRGDE